MVSKEELNHIAKLALIDLPEDKIENYQKNLDEILEFVETISNVDLTGIDITIGANDKNRFREDKILEFEDREALLQNAPSKQNNMFKIPKVIK